MKTNNNFRKFGDDSQRGGQVKGGKMPAKEKKLKRSIYEEIDEDEEIGYRNLKKKESIEDYLDYEHGFSDDDEFEDSEFDDDDENHDDDEWFDDDDDDDEWFDEDEEDDEWFDEESDNEQVIDR